MTTVASATAPDGSNLIGASGWTFTVVNPLSQFRVGHPLGDVFVGAWSAGINGTVVTRRAFFNFGTTQYSMQENSSYNQIDFYNLSNTQAGYGTGNSTLTFYLCAKS